MAKNGDSILIRDLKRYASDYELSRRPINTEPCEIIHRQRIGIIGAGPAGLAAAVDLIRLGYPVTVFEASDEPGGMLRYGIPAYRLPDRILKREIDWIKGLGINIETSKKISDPASLLKKGFSAILIAGGAPKSLSLGIEGEKAKGVINALEFLRTINQGDFQSISGHVVVIGAGSTAFDAARSAVRIGAKKVTLAYRRSIKEMPAEKEEIDAAIDENVEILTLVIPKRIHQKNGRVTGIEFYKAELKEKDKTGRPRPIPIKDSEFTLKADIIILAIGAMADIGFVGGLKVITQDGVINVGEDCKTQLEGVFAAGDVEMGPSTVVDAIGRGHIAARGIDAYLNKTSLSESEEIVKTLQIVLGSSVCSKIKYKPKKLIDKAKVSDFNEVYGSLDDFQAVEEASRCLSCGACYACPVCLPNCVNKQLVAKIKDTTVLVKVPRELSYELYEEQTKDIQVKFKDSEVTMKLFSLTSKVDKDLCISCGRCEEVCAYRAIKNIVSKDEKTYSQVDHGSCASCSACVSECPSGAITQGYMSDNEILSRLENKESDYKDVKAFMNFWSNPSSYFGSHKGIVELMSTRKPSPMFLIRALARTGRGLLIIKPDESTGCHYLPWEEPPEMVIESTCRILKSIGISPDRIKYTSITQGEKPTELLKNFSDELEKKGLKSLKIHFTKYNLSPFGEAIAIMKIFRANPDNEPEEDLIKIPPVTPHGVALFEGCLPMLHVMGGAHKFYDLFKTRLSILELFKWFNIDVGAIPGFSCPSKGLLQFNTEEIEKKVRKINDNNQELYKKAKPKKMIIATPEAFSSLSDDKNYTNVVSIVDELLNAVKKIKDLKPVEKTVALHKACKMENDPFYQSTKKILEMIPGLKIVEISNKCGNSNFNKIAATSKKDAINIMDKAVEKGADFIVCTSPYCQSHLLLCSREGSWRSNDIDITDVYQILLKSLTGES